MSDGTRWGYIGPRDMTRDPEFERKPRDPRSRVVDRIDFDDPNMAWLADLAKIDAAEPESSDGGRQAREQA